MPIISITNTSKGTVSLGSSIGSVQAHGTKVTDVSVADLEQLSDTLAELQTANLITWGIITQDSGNRTEFFPAGVSATKTQGRLDLYVDDIYYGRPCSRYNA